MEDLGGSLLLVSGTLKSEKLTRYLIENGADINKQVTVENNLKQTTIITEDGVAWLEKQRQLMRNNEGIAQWNASLAFPPKPPVQIRDLTPPEMTKTENKNDLRQRNPTIFTLLSHTFNTE